MQQLDLEKIKTATADGARRKKFTISTVAERRLRAASKKTGRTMSDLVDMLIMQGLPEN